MSHRRPEPNQTALENVLRNALRLAANSVDPAADGLDLIRAKISARRPGLLPGWWTAVPVLLWPLLRRLEPVADWLRYALGVITDRFRPEPARAGRLAWLGWLRPAAAMATGLFVVAAASLAIAALPAVIHHGQPLKHGQPQQRTGQRSSGTVQRVRHGLQPPQRARDHCPGIGDRLAKLPCHVPAGHYLGIGQPERLAQPEPDHLAVAKLVAEPVADGVSHRQRHANAERLRVEFRADQHSGRAGQSGRSDRSGDAGQSGRSDRSGGADRLAARLLGLGRLLTRQFGHLADAAAEPAAVALALRLTGAAGG